MCSIEVRQLHKIADYMLEDHHCRVSYTILAPDFLFLICALAVDLLDLSRLAVLYLICLLQILGFGNEKSVTE